MSKRARAPEIANAVRDSMLDAATAVFARKGYAAATMKEIAAEAGYTAPAFYNYFKGKEQLFEALLGRTFEEIIATLVEPVPRAKGFEERLEALMRRQFALADVRTDTFRVLMSAQVTKAAGPAEGGALRAEPEGYRQLMALLTAWFVDASGGPRVVRLEARDAAMVYMAVIQAFHAQWMAERPPGRFVDRVGLVLDVVLHGLGGGKKRAPDRAHGTARAAGAKAQASDRVVSKRRAGARPPRRSKG
jgi:AcrR family transcriptional regulator